MVALLIHGRSRVRHGPFWLGKNVGLVANLVVLTWTAFIIIVYSFPTTMPATPGSMNYVSALYLTLVLAMSFDWCVRARSEFRGHLNKEAILSGSGDGVAMVAVQNEISSGRVLAGAADSDQSAVGSLRRTGDHEAS